MIYPHCRYHVVLITIANTLLKSILVYFFSLTKYEQMGILQRIGNYNSKSARAQCNMCSVLVRNSRHMTGWLNDMQEADTCMWERRCGEVPGSL